MGADKPSFPMNRISVSLSGLPVSPPVYDVVIVGSGYGGSIAASKLARAGKKVCLLERGREILPGDYPTDLPSARDELQLVTARAGRLQPDKNALMEVRVNDDAHVILGNGLGGGSLVNANVSIVPDGRVFNEVDDVDVRLWPKLYESTPTGQRELDGKAGWTSVLSHHYADVKKNLGATKINRTLNKLTALQRSAAVMKQPFEFAEINVTFTAGKNKFGFDQAACTMCGDCCSGCNYGAKNTLLMNYLPDAKKYGATLVTEAEVDTIMPAGTGWKVFVYDRSKPFEGQTPIPISSQAVILAAGALGSTEILLRSSKAQKGLTVSKALGTRFSGNGDVLGFGFAANLPDSSPKPAPGQPALPTALYSIGAGTNPATEPQYQPGPCITGIIRVDMGDDDPLSGGLVIEDGTAPGPFAAIYPPMLFMQEVLDADPFAYPDSATRLGGLQKLGQALQSGTDDPSTLSYTGVMTQLQSYLVMSHDDSAGTLALPEGVYPPPPGTPPALVHIKWRNAGRGAPYAKDNAKLAEAAEAIWANYIPNPIWQEGFGRNVVSVHPLGGCPMSDSETTGATDPLCRVYKGTGDNAFYPNLLVCDGSVIPTSLGVNPLLTISAITSFAIDKFIATLPATEPATAAAPPEPPARREPVAAVASTDPLKAYVGAIALAATNLSLVSTSCKNGDPFAAKGEMAVAYCLAFNTYVTEYTTDWSTFFASFFDGAKDLKNDIAPGIAQISADLVALATALSKVSVGTSSVQPFLQTFFARIGDVTPSLKFSEGMRGAVSARRISQKDAISDPYDIAAAIGAATGQTLSGNFSFESKGSAAYDTNCKVIPNVLDVTLTGCVQLTGTDGKTTQYCIKNGTFDFLPPDPDTVETWCMVYNCELWADGATAASWKFAGKKYLANRPGAFWWTDITTLYVDLTPLAQAGTTIALQGIIKLDLQDVAAQSVTFQPDFDAMSLDALKQRALDAAANGTFHTEVSDTTENGLLPQAFRVLLDYALNNAPQNIWPAEFAQGLVKFYEGNLAGLFGQRILQAHGGFLSYMEDFPSQADGTIKVFPEVGETLAGWTFEAISVPAGADFDITLFHFTPPNGTVATKGPILVAPGMSTTSRSFALLTNDDPSLVERLLKENYDVWLFDSRFSPPHDGQPAQSDYTLDDIAAEDWPAAVNYVLANSPLTKGRANGTVQILAHCVGALTAQMALLGGHVPTGQVRQMVLMQFTVHPAANWFNVVKQETGLAQDLVSGFPKVLVDLIKSQIHDVDLIDMLQHGSPTINLVSPKPPPPPPPPPPNSPPPPPPEITPDVFFTTVAWNAPFGSDHMCLSPTCHRIYAAYGPVIAHKNVNLATHDALRQIFGRIATKPFEQLGLIMRHGRAVSADGQDAYLSHPERLDLPIHIISGTINQIVLPESGDYTHKWLIKHMPNSASKFTRRLIEGYAHNDCIIGKNVNADVFDGPKGLLAELGKYSNPAA